MQALTATLARRARPRAGWSAATLALTAAIAPAVAAADASLRLPAASFLWAGVLGLLLGMRAAPRGEPAGRARGGLLLALALLAGAALVAASYAALPPLGLLSQDVSALGAWAGPIVRREAALGPPPAVQSPAFLQLSLARYWAELQAAPTAGEGGARLLVGAAGIALTWAGALALGRALPGGRQVAGWSTPLLAALVFTAVLGDAKGAALALGIGALVLAVVASSSRARQAEWERRGADYSDELGRDVLGWGLGLVLVALLAAWVVPLWPGNPLAQIFQQQELPSGIAALQRGMQRPRDEGATRVGISTLPEVQLGESLEQGPPEQTALRVRVSGPLPEGPAPRYWRVRLLNIYSGGGWASDARIAPEPATTMAEELPPELVVQQVEDLRRDRTLVAGLADVVGVSVPARAERLEDGSLAALALDAAPERYQVLSRRMEFAPPRPLDREPPSLVGYLGRPQDVTPRVRDLASIVSGSDNRLPPMERALRIERYLRELPYDYEVAPLPRGGDAVDQFLFEMRRGYCTYYASAMAVMARSIGIPARVAVGYATGSYDDAAGVYVVREAEAHAWPELYIGDRWVIFEPTPVRPVPARAAAGQAPQPGPAAAAAPEAQDRTTGPLIWAGLLALVAAAAAAGALLGRGRRPPTPVARAQIVLERFGARAGVPWPAGATLHEYGALLAPHAGVAAAALSDVVDLVELARYSGRPLDREAEGRLLVASERLGEQRRQG